MPIESPKLRMQEPERYDFTDNKVGTFQASQFNAVVKKAYWQGVEDTSLPATVILAMGLISTLVTAAEKIICLLLKQSG